MRTQVPAVTEVLEIELSSGTGLMSPPLTTACFSETNIPRSRVKNPKIIARQNAITLNNFFLNTKKRTDNESVTTKNITKSCHNGILGSSRLTAIPMLCSRAILSFLIEPEGPKEFLSFFLKEAI